MCRRHVAAAGQVAKMEGMASHAAELEEALKKEMEAGGF